jgi:nitrite reductase (NO-forming)
MDYEQSAADERPQHVLCNGNEGVLIEKPCVMRQDDDETLRIYFGNAGPNLVSSFHVIGGIFDKVYRGGGVDDPPARDSIQTTLLPAGGAVVVDMSDRKSASVLATRSSS